MSARDYYEILGIDKSADEQSIKRAYRKLAMKYHPDKNADDEKAAALFREVTEAYEVLSDAEKRRKYDQYGHAGVDDQMHDFWSGGGFQQSHAFKDFGDLFGDIFGGGGGFGSQSRSRGASLKFQLDLSLEEAASGKEVEVKIPRHESCETCHGSGAKPGTNPIPCSTCGGHGQVQMSQGLFAIRQTCPSCQGSGRKIESPCASCSGSGRVRTRKSLKVRIPEGVYDGAQVRVSGEGEAGEHGTPAGDLYIIIALKPHPIFERDGPDLHATMPITFPQAVLGSEADVPTLEGPVKVKIKPGTESGQVYRLRNYGVRDLRTGSKGDLFVKTQVAVPKKLNKEQKELLRQFADITGDEVYPERSSFLGKAKRFWDELSGETS